MSHIQYPIEFPPHVAAARAAASGVGFGLLPGGGSNGTACLTEFGPILSVLAAMRPGGRIAEIGTGVGVGTGWLAHGLAGGATLTTVEIDPARAAVAAKLFADRSDVAVLVGDWRETLAHLAPFDLVFLDGGYAAELDQDRRGALIDLVCVGGTLVLDDVTPEQHWPDTWRGRADPKREFALRDDRLLSAEFRVTDTEGGLLCVRTK